MNTEKKSKRVVFTMGGKGGVGKTGLMVALAEWFEANEIPFTLLDLDTENKARGSLKHFFNGSVSKVNIHTPAGLDSFVDHLESGATIILADMGAGSGQVASDWFDAMYEDVSATGAFHCSGSCHARPGKRRERPRMGEPTTGSGSISDSPECDKSSGRLQLLGVG